MSLVNIVVDVSDGHLASIYALVMSIITNKHKESVYHIYFSVQDQVLSQLGALFSIQTDMVRMSPVTKAVPSIHDGVEIRLQWNMIVMGDLTELVNSEPEECERETCFDISCRVDSPILHIDPAFSPEEYFDHPLANQWLKYYKISPMKNVSLRRRSYVETLGEISVKGSESSIPIAISTCDIDIPNAVALLYSIRKNTASYTQLDIRVFYRNLSAKHAEVLLSFRDENTSIVLYNVKRCTDADDPNIRIMPALLVFDEYETLIYMDSKCLCLGDVVSLYRNAGEPYDVCIIGDNPDTEEMPKMMLLNTTSWIQNDIFNRYVALSREYKCFQKLVYMAAEKRVDSLKSFPICSFQEEDNPWMCSDETISQLVWRYLSMSPDYEQLKAEALSYDLQRKVATMQELLKRLKDLEIENNRLSQQVQQLEEDNTSLRSERDQFQYELLETRKSFTYRLARAISFLPRKLRGEGKTTE